MPIKIQLMECRVTVLMLVYQLVMAVLCNAIDVVILITVLAKNGSNIEYNLVFLPKI